MDKAKTFIFETSYYKNVVNGNFADYNTKFARLIFRPQYQNHIGLCTHTYSGKGRGWVR